MTLSGYRLAAYKQKVIAKANPSGASNAVLASRLAKRKANGMSTTEAPCKKPPPAFTGGGFLVWLDVWITSNVVNHISTVAEVHHRPPQNLPVIRLNSGRKANRPETPGH